MRRLYQSLGLTGLICAFFSMSALAQPDTTTTSVDPELENIFFQKVPKEYIVASVAVSGNKFFDNALLTSVANLNVGDKIMIPGGDNFSKAVQNLWNQNYFSYVTIYIVRLEQPNKLHLEINVTERPRLGKFEFRGAGVTKSNKEDLDKKSNLIPGRIVTENMKRNAVEAITKFYAEKGFMNVKVQVAESPSPTVQNSLDLVFNIDKSNKVKIEDVYIAGNKAVEEQKLEKQMKGTKERLRLSLYPVRDTPVYARQEGITFEHFMKEKDYLQPTKIKDFIEPYFRFKFGSAKFNQQKFDEDKEKVLAYYNAKGFRDARITDDTVYMNKAGNLIVELKVDEGRPYYFGNIVFRGNTKYSDSVLNLILGIKKGDIYNLETLNKRVGKQLSQDGGDISALYMDDGYLFFRAEPIETAVYNDTIDHEIRLVEGPQATIAKVVISGNDKTKEHVIRRELRTLPGEKFSRSDLIRSQREIANLNYFNQEKIGINPIPNQQDGTVDIHYTVEEKSSDQLELSAGWGGGIGLTGTLGVTFNNFSIKNILKKDSWDPLPSGDGQKLSLRFQSNGRAYQSYNASFTEPWLGGKKRNSFTVSLFHTKFASIYDYATNTYLKNPSSYISTIGASVGLGRQLKWPDDFFTLVTSLNYTRYKLKEYAIFSDFSNGVSNNVNFKIALQRSSVDQQIFPRSGSNFMASLQLTPPWSLLGVNNKSGNSAESYKFVEYHKWRLNAEWYVPLGRAKGEERNKQFVLKLAAKYGFLGRYNQDRAISPFERFQVGDAGMSNNNGFIGFDIIAHRGYPVYQTSNPKINPDQQGASQYFTIFNKYTAEIRYPLSLNPSSTIYALGFFEAANGWYDMKTYNPFQLRRSVGIGARFFLPMFGLLGFDYGIGLDRLTPGGGLKNAARFTFMLGYEPE